jgi:hypothetical protein
MTTVSTTARPTRTPTAPRDLDPLQLLREGHEGRLGYLSGRGARSVVVRFALTADGIRIRLAEYHEAVGYADGRQVSLRVEEMPGAGRSPSTVEVRGRAHLAPYPTRETEQASDLERWPADVATHEMVIPLTELTVLSAGAGADPVD